jgi:DNA repair exonuclease SbcCD ATPase subunit
MLSVSDNNVDTSLQAEVERLRALAPDTKALYREVASTLFFRFGVAPTANRLYQLVGKGSMATAASVLARFWQDLREHGRLRLEHPAVPEPLRDTGGELIGQIWKTAYDQAQADLAQVRVELQDEAVRARAELDQACQAAGEADSRVEELALAAKALQARIAEQDDVVADRDRELIRVHAEVASLRASLESARNEVDQSRQAFKGELEALRAVISLTEERARSGERRALAEIDISRRKAGEYEKALAVERRRHQSENERLAKLVAKREAELQAVRDRLVRAETSLGQTSAQLKAEQGKFSKLLSKVRPAGPAVSGRARSRGRDKRATGAN